MLKVKRNIKNWMKQVFNSHALVLAVTMAVVPLVTSCAAPLIAAGAGAMMGNEENRESVTQFFEDLSESINRSISQTSDAGSTREDLDYQKDSGLILRLNNSDVTPPRVRTGEKVVVSVQYALVGAPNEGINVEEARLLWFKGEQLAKLNEDVERRESGTWESTLSFRVPDVAESGTYEIIQKLRAEEKKVTASVFFEVESG